MTPEALAALRRAALEPPRATDDLADLAGQIRATPEDFVVEEIPAYPTQASTTGEPGHVFVWLQKRNLTTEEAVREVARALRVPRPEIGVAGLKDRVAVTRQQISLPARQDLDARIAGFEHPAITLADPRPHGHKLRRGHLQGNRFCIRVRDIELPADEILARATAKLGRIAAEGLRNYYGGQRFGKDGRNLEPGLAALAGRGRRRPKGDLTLSAGQSALFNLYLAQRAERGLLRTLLVGDVVQKRASGGMFETLDLATDQARLDAGELVITGPMFGSKTRSPSPGSPSLALEDGLLELVGLSRAKLAKLGKIAPGTRRQLLIWPELDAPRVDGGVLELRFVLPPGSYATVLLRELCG